MKTIACAAIMLALVTNIALANDLADTISDAKANGVTFDLKDNNLTINVDVVKAYAALSSLINDHTITSDQYPVAELPQTPVLADAIVGIIYTQEMIPYFYNGTQVDNLNATINILTINKYGNVDTNKCITFVFNRALYNKINWDHQNNHLLIDLKDDTNFNYTDLCNDAISEELKKAVENESNNDDSTTTTTTYSVSEIQALIQSADNNALGSQ